MNIRDLRLAREHALRAYVSLAESPGIVDFETVADALNACADANTAFEKAIAPLTTAERLCAMYTEEELFARDLYVAATKR